MKRIMFLAIGFFFLTCGVSSAGFYGPAQSQVAPGQLSAGVGVATNEEDWDFDFDTLGSAVFDIHQQQYYVQAAIGLGGTAELYTHVGLTTLDIDDALAINEFRDSAPFATIGLKTLLYRGKYFDAGAFAEGSYFSSYEDTAATVKIEFDESYSVNGGIVFQKQIENAIIYGGPSFHFREGDFQFTSPNGVSSGSFERNTNFGGFAGYRLSATEDIVVDIELQVREKFSVAGGLSFLF